MDVKTARKLYYEQFVEFEWAIKEITGIDIFYDGGFSKNNTLYKHTQKIISTYEMFLVFKFCSDDLFEKLEDLRIIRNTLAHDRGSMSFDDKCLDLCDSMTTYLNQLEKLSIYIDIFKKVNDVQKRSDQGFGFWAQYLIGMKKLGKHYSKNKIEFEFKVIKIGAAETVLLMPKNKEDEDKANTAETMKLIFDFLTTDWNKVFNDSKLEYNKHLQLKTKK